MRIAWAIEGKGAGGADVPDVDAAASALSAAVRDVYGSLGTGSLATVLTAVLGPLRASLVTDGRYAVERGSEWSTQVGGILVTLHP